MHHGQNKGEGKTCKVGKKYVNLTKIGMGVESRGGPGADISPKSSLSIYPGNFFGLICLK